MCVCVPTAVCITLVLVPLMGKWGLCNTTIAARREELLRRHPTSSLCLCWASGRGVGPSMAEFHFITQSKMRKHSAAAILSSWETCADPSSGHDPGFGDRSGSVICRPRGCLLAPPPGSSFPLGCAALKGTTGPCDGRAEPWWEIVQSDYMRAGKFPVLTSNLEIHETGNRRGLTSAHDCKPVTGEHAQRATAFPVFQYRGTQLNTQSRSIVWHTLFTYQEVIRHGDTYKTENTNGGLLVSLKCLFIFKNKSKNKRQESERTMKSASKQVHHSEWRKGKSKGNWWIYHHL